MFLRRLKKNCLQETSKFKKVRILRVPKYSGVFNAFLLTSKVRVITKKLYRFSVIYKKPKEGKLVPHPQVKNHRDHIAQCLARASAEKFSTLQSNLKA